MPFPEIFCYRRLSRTIKIFSLLHIKCIFAAREMIVLNNCQSAFTAAAAFQLFDCVMLTGVHGRARTPFRPPHCNFIPHSPPSKDDESHFCSLQMKKNDECVAGLGQLFSVFIWKSKFVSPYYVINDVRS